MKYIISITLIICIFSNHFFSQNIKNIDSLLLVSKTSRDTSLINVLNLIGSYYTNSDLDTSNYYLNLSVKNVETLIKNGNGDDYYIAILEIKKVNAIKFIGYNSYQKGNYKEATSIYNNALVDLSNILDNKKKLTTKQEIDIQTQILKLKSVIIGNIGLVFHKQGDYSNAIENYLSAIKIADNLNDKKLLSIHFSNIGGVYMIQKNYEKALDYAYKSLKIKEELGNKNGIAITLNNLGIIYKNLGRYKEALDMYDRAFALNKDLKSKVGIGFNMANMAIVYALQKDYAKALDLNVKVLSIKEEIGDLNGTGLAMSNIGHIKFVLGKYNEAEKYLLSANDIAKKIQSLELLKETHQFLFELYDYKENSNLSLFHYKKYILFKDSLNNLESVKSQINSELSYEFDKKRAIDKANQEKKDAIAKEDKEKQKIIIYSTIIVLIIVLSFLFLLFNRLKVIQKQNSIIEQKEKETQKQNEIILHQKSLVEEKHKEITDSINYAERIQRSFLASKEILDRSFKDYFVLFKPKDIVSGDFYWVSNLKNGNFVLATADSTGHGVPGAIMSIVNISCLKEAVIQGIVDPSLILNETRKLVIENLKNDGSRDGGKDGMDCSLISFDFKNSKLYCSAANNPIWIIRGSELIEIKPDRMPVGKHDNDSESFTLNIIDLQEGDLIYTLTDGFSDQFGGEGGKKYKSKKLQDLLVKICNIPMAEQKQKLDEVFENWKGNLEQVDDVTIIGVRV